MLQTIPLTYRCQQAVNFIQQSRELGLWLALGGQSAWEHDDNPPVPDPRWTAVPEPISYHRVDYVAAVFPDATGPLFTANGNYQPISQPTVENLLTAKAFNIFIAADANFKDTGLIAANHYRILGLTMGLRRLYPEALNKALTPEGVINPGTLVWLASQRPARFSPEEGLALRTVIHF